MLDHKNTAEELLPISKLHNDWLNFKLKQVEYWQDKSKTKSASVDVKSLVEFKLDKVKEDMIKEQQRDSTEVAFIWHVFKIRDQVLEHAKETKVTSENPREYFKALTTYLNEQGGRKNFNYLADLVLILQKANEILHSHFIVDEYEIKSINKSSLPSPDDKLKLPYDFKINENFGNLYTRKIEEAMSGFLIGCADTVVQKKEVQKILDEDKASKELGPEAARRGLVAERNLQEIEVYLKKDLAAELAIVKQGVVRTFWFDSFKSLMDDLMKQPDKSYFPHLKNVANKLMDFANADLYSFREAFMQLGTEISRCKLHADMTKSIFQAKKGPADLGEILVAIESNKYFPVGVDMKAERKLSR